MTAQQGWVTLIALFTVTFAGLAAGIAGVLITHQIQELTSERDALQLQALRDAAIAHAVGMARAGQVPGGQQVDFALDFGEGRIEGLVLEITGRRDQPGRGVYRIEVRGDYRGRFRRAKTQLNTVRSPAQLTGLEPVPAWRD